MNMNNNIKFLGSFDDYIYELKDIAKTHRCDKNQLGINIRTLQIDSDFIENNISYFREQYDSNYTPINTLSQIETDIDELLFKLTDIPDDNLIEEINNRNLGKYCIEYIHTDDLEEEVLSRWDKSLIEPGKFSRDELLEELGIDEGDILDGNDSVKAVICKALGFNNSFAYSKEDIINEINKKL